MMNVEPLLRTELVWQASRSGHRVPMINGRACHSLVDPVREARQWVDQAATVVNGLKSPLSRVIVLGGGAGFHVRDLLDKIGKLQTEVVVIERNKVLFEDLETQFAGEIRNSRLQLLGGNDQHFGNSDANSPQLSAKSTIVLAFAGVVQCYENYYQQCRKYFLVQTEQAWQEAVASRSLKVSRKDFFERATLDSRHPLHVFIQEESAGNPIAAALLELFS
jgi:hypothetical protein